MSARNYIIGNYW